MSTPTPRTDAAYAEWQSSWTRTPFGPDFARTLERELAESRNAERLARVQLGAEREKVRVLRSACESICEEWGRNHDAPFCAGSEMEKLATAALAATEDAP